MRDFPGVPVARPVCSQCRGLRFDVITKNLFVATKYATCLKEDHTSCVPQLRPGAAR